MMAAAGGYIEIVMVLIEAGADVNLKGLVSCWNECNNNHAYQSNLGL